MTSRIPSTFKRLKKAGRKAFIPYIMAGDPSLEATKEIIVMFEECGADIVEIGIPFSDPLADGPTIQNASERALANGVTLKRVISHIEDIRRAVRLPLVIMTYFNPIYKYGISEFLRDAKHAGIDGMIVPDFPPDEAKDYITQSKKAGLDTIFLLAPTSTEKRIKIVTNASSGFIYYVSITGITGSNLLLDGSMDVLIGKIRQYTKKPVAVGFGVSTPDDAAKVAKIADGVIVGTAIVKRLNEDTQNLKNYLISLREAIA
jgi:tryptophan synthase alpha chain